MAARLTRELPGFLRTAVGVDDARQQTQQNLATREQRFLTIVQATIYEQPRSPYRRLLAHAGCQPGDLRRLVQQDGIEGALSILAERGVYVTFDEFKGRQPAIRGSARFSFADHDFDNAAVPAHYLMLTSGSGGKPTRTRRPLSSTTDGAMAVALAFEAHNIRAPHHVFWLGAQPAWAFVHLKMGQPIDAWFYPIHPMPPIVQAAMPFLSWLVRRGGRELPPLVSCDLMQPEVIARWLVRHRTAGRTLVVNTRTSSAVRVALEATRVGESLAGIVFHCRGEPLSAARKRHIEASGAYVLTSYASIEFPFIAYACAEGTNADDLHLCHDRYAIVERARPIVAGGPTVDAMLLTSISMAAGKIAFNTETGDAARLEQRDCGCSLGALGFRTHLSDIRSFEKLSSEGTTFARGEILTILDEVLPARFGGSAVDYQIVEEEAADGSTRLALRVHPDLGPVDEDAVRATLLAELGRGGVIEAHQARMLQRAQAIVVQRRVPLATKAGKVLPFQLLRHAQQADQARR